MRFELTTSMPESAPWTSSVTFEHESMRTPFTLVVMSMAMSLRGGEGGG